MTVEIHLNATDLRERATPYEEMLPINVRTAITAGERTMLLPVSLSVKAATDFLVWGVVGARERCSAAAIPENWQNVTTLVGVTRQWPFTACGTSQCDSH